MRPLAHHRRGTDSSLRGRNRTLTNAVVAGWFGVAALLDKQGEPALAGEVRQFVKDLPPVLTDRERIASELIRHLKAQGSARTRGYDVVV